jgi:hypothetical protein
MDTKPRDPIPIVVLGGRDTRAAEMPSGGRDKHPLVGFKAVDIRIAGRRLIDCVLECFGKSGLFDPVYVVGPASVYRDLADGVTVVDAHGGIDSTLRTAVTDVSARHPGVPVAFTTCDVLPDLDTLAAYVEEYRRNAPCHVFMPMIKAPADRRALGASSWKPTYRIVPGRGQAPVGVLPCHLLVMDLDAVKTEFVFRIAAIIYRTRNRSIAYRRRVVLRSVMRELLYQDWRNVLTLHLPNITWTALVTGFVEARRLRAGTLTRIRLEDFLRTMFITIDRRRRYPDRRVSMPIIDGLSLALDIDTEEEARVMGAAPGSHGV